MPRNVTVEIAPSILSADFSRLGEQVWEATEGGADRIHVDIMDGQFVPNLTIGPVVVQSIRSWTTLPLDIHMMVIDPGRFVIPFVKAGADLITVHAEACTHLHTVIDQIRQAGAKAGVAINPATPVSVLEGVMADLDQVLVMTVNPGFGGQVFIDSMVDKITRIRELLDGQDLSAGLGVDGGINVATAKITVQAGARVLVAGSAVYRDDINVIEAIDRIRTSVADL